MKTKKIIYLLLLSLIVLACKTEKKEAIVQDEEKVKTFDVTVDIVIPTDDELILFYKDGTNEWFVENKAVWAGVKGKNEVQTVVFNLPEGVLPNDLRLDIGRNEFKGLKSIEIKKLKISYLDKNFEINEDQIGNYFKPNQYINFDQATKVYTFKKDDKGNYDPSFETKPEFYPQIAKVALNQ